MFTAATVETILSLLRKFWWVLPVAALLVALLVTDGKLQRARTDLANEQKAHLATKAAAQQTDANYRQATAQAQLDAKANAERVRAEQERATQETVNEYEAMAAATAERYRSLQQRVRAFEANTSGPGGAGVSLAGAATCAAYAGTPCEEIPPLLNEAELNTNQLLALQEWVRRQSAISVKPQKKSKTK